MTTYEKQELKSGLLRMLRYGLLFAICVWISAQLVSGKSAHAQAIPQALHPGVSAPSIKSFYFIAPNGNKYGVVSWFEDGVKCTSVTSNDPGSNATGMPVSVSCVKL